MRGIALSCLAPLTSSCVLLWVGHEMKGSQMCVEPLAN